MITVAKLLRKNQKGQALVEFLVFLPFMLMIYSVTHSMSNAIFASINQQKALRGYFYFKTAGNSHIPAPTAGAGGDFFSDKRQFGFQAFGWMERLDGEEPVAPCFKFNLLLGQDDEDECEESYSEPTTQFIRVMTVYGVCGASYVRVNENVEAYPKAAIAGDAISRCSIIQ